MRSWWLLLLIPLASAELSLAPEPHETTMYVHQAGFGDGIVLTQEPAVHVGTFRGLGPSLSCLETGQNVGGQAGHTWYSYAATGTVEEAGEPNTWRGLADALELSGRSLHLTWHLEAQGPGPAPAVGVPVPEVTLEATLKTGASISVNHESFEQGEVIATARSLPATLSPHLLGDHPEVRYVPWEGREIYAFDLELPLQQHEVDEDGFNLRVDAYIDLPGCQDRDAYIMDGRVAAFSGPEHLNRFTWNVQEPLRFEHFWPQLIGKDVVITATAISPFGSADIGSFNVTSTGPADFEGAAIDRGDVHGATRAPWLGQWVAKDALDGAYQVTMELATLQGATQKAVLDFDLEAGELTVQRHCMDGLCEARMPVPQEQTTPSPLLLAPLLTALFLRRLT